MAAARVWHDAMGRAVPIRDGVQRIVSLVPSMTEVLFAYGFGAEVVGITDYCTEPASEVLHKTRLGGTKNPDIEACWLCGQR
jgi:ABC-type Fe3+-hydroxamate transport system substrate-binding protein